MAIVIKEIRVNTIVEKKIIQNTEISENVYQEIKEEVLRELSRRLPATSETKKKER